MKTGRNSIRIEPMTGAIGAEVHGIDLARDLDDETFAMIHEAYLEYLVLCFRDQNLTPEQHAAFGRRFGPLMVHPYVKPMDEHPDVMRIVKDVNETHAFGSELWHSDMTFMEKPASASILCAREVPKRGGDTLFANMYLAYETLSPGMKRIIDGLKTVNREFSATAGKTVENKLNNASMKFVNPDQAHGPVLHPVVRTHPETRRKLLYGVRSDTERFEDMTEEESRSLVQVLSARATRPELTMRVRFRPGTVVLWDNRCAQHLAINDYDGHRRVMDRVTIQGERPF